VSIKPLLSTMASMMLVVFPWPAASQPCKPLTVCEALARIDTMQDQIVTVQGVVWRSSHGDAMVAGAKGCKGLPPDRQYWVPSIAIESPDDSSVRRDRIPTFDSSGYDQLSAALDRSGGECAVILTGEIRFRPDAWFKIRDGEVIGGGGYGQMGRLPAQLIVRDFLGILPVQKNGDQQ
jgi:hypothetical protein